MMNSPMQPTNHADFYFDLLKNLNSDSKLDLILKLPQ